MGQFHLLLQTAKKTLNFNVGIVVKAVYGEELPQAEHIHVFLYEHSILGKVRSRASRGH